MREIEPQGGSGRTAGRSHEGRDLRVTIVALFGLVLTATLVGSHFLLRGVFAGYSVWTDRAERPRPPLREARVVPPQPRLQDNPSRDLESLRTDERRRLESYGWIDRERRILHIPIERAMEQVMRRGVPTRPVRTAD